MENIYSEEIKNMIHTKGLTQTSFAMKLKISPEHLCNIMRGGLSVADRDALAAALEGDLSIWRTLHGTRGRKPYRIIHHPACGNWVVYVAKKRSVKYCPFCGKAMEEGA